MKFKQIPEDFIVKEIKGFESDNGLYNVFLLKKTDYTTEKAVQIISKALGIKRTNIGYAGIKDRRAVTEQYISIFKVSKIRVENLKLKNLSLKFVSTSKNALAVGELKGNEFNIIVRNLPKNTKIRANARIKNYFDEQRFSNKNSEIGLAIIKKNFKKAVEFVLENSGDYEKDVKTFLDENQNDYIGALKKIPFRIRLLFIHAYQSSLFNRLIEKLDLNENIKVPIVGFATEYEDDFLKKKLKKLLVLDDVTERDFIIPSIPSLSSEGSSRLLYVIPKNLFVGDLEKDDLNKYKYKLRLRFSLVKGAYATIVVKNLLN
ncbi:hypothetical protein CMO90_03410 [Candidatus Woesearchaeota archaeon]|jgi:tRNA pseudouridine13 synthase|nr:hypothetical protein [Candidatus Woesearchaeota archaeon]|tara:strand:- start:322 stop:1275 length:954 start_codon:yes stop_codon:yes gene_type:complete